MRKRIEAVNPDSCWNRADQNEWIFVLLGRDVAAPAAIEAWCQERIRLGKNTEDDPQIQEARACASYMASEREKPADGT